MMKVHALLVLQALIVDCTFAWCPPLSVVPTTIRNTVSRPRALNENCCQGGGAPCSCGEGLQCCSNNDFRFLCVEDPCTPNPCGNGVCATDHQGGRRCFCSVGTIRDQNGLCLDDPCFRNPCGRGGRCSPNIFGGSRSYNCRCSGDQVFDGKTCVADSCNRLLCGRGQCRINGRQRAVCECVQGFRFDGRSCIRIDPCRAHSCGAGGHCSAFNGRAVCRCNVGFRLDSRTRRCVSDNPCSNVDCGRGSCVRSGAVRAVCNCEAGFRFRQRSMTCVPLPTQPTQATTSAPRQPERQTVVTTRLGGACSRVSCSCTAGFQQNIATNTCQVTNPCNASVTPTTFDLGDGSPGRIAAGSRSGCLKSRNFPENYPSNLFDEVAIPTEGFTTLTVTIQQLQIQTSGSSSEGFTQNNCLRDYLFISGQLFCGSLDPQGAHRVLDISVGGRSKVIVGMSSDESISFQGFLLKWELS